jgi:hypothetical protein
VGAKRKSGALCLYISPWLISRGKNAEACLGRRTPHTAAGINEMKCVQIGQCVAKWTALYFTQASLMRHAQIALLMEEWACAGFTDRQEEHPRQNALRLEKRTSRFYPKRNGP